MTPIDRRVRLHFKVLEFTDDQKKKKKPNFTPDQLLEAMQKVYRPWGIDVVSAPKIDYLGRLLDTNLEVGSCDLLTPTTQQKALFAHRADPSTTGKDVPDDEICVYFLYGTIRSGAGCASCEKTNRFPYGRPAAVVTVTATKWTLAHECGHVLGLSHEPNKALTNRVMLAETARIAADPAVLTAPEAATIKASHFTKPA